MPLAELGDVTIHYQSRGSGTAVIGIMGFALDQRYWAAQIPPVTRNNRFITFDNRGVGRSTGHTTYTMDEMADDAYRLLQHLEIDKAVVFGMSMGSAIAQRLVLDHPDIASGLILGMTFARPLEFMRRQHQLSRELIGALGPESLMQASLIRMFSPQFFEMGREMVDQIAGAFLADGSVIPSADVLNAQLTALDKHDTLADLPSIKCPTLVLGAKMDQMVPYIGSVEVARAIPNAELVTFETGHGCSVEEMELFNRSLEEFLAQL